MEDKVYIEKPSSEHYAMEATVKKLANEKALPGNKEWLRHKDTAEKSWKAAMSFIKAQNSFTVEQMLEAISYGFTYHRDSMSDDNDVPQGNKLQWLLSKYVPIEKHSEWLVAYKEKKQEDSIDYRLCVEKKYPAALCYIDETVDEYFIVASKNGAQISEMSTSVNGAWKSAYEKSIKQQ